MGLTTPHRLRPAAVATVSVLLASVFIAVAPAVADTAPPEATTPETVSSDALDTAQIDGVAWDQVIIGDTVYVGGNFSTARPAGSAADTNTVARTHLLAYDLATGALKPWAPTVNAQVRSLAASPDGTRLYVGGDFTTINGTGKNRIAAFDTATGSLITAFSASANAPVYAVSATASTVYFGGQFSQARGVARQGAAAATAATGATTAWAPIVAGGRVFDLVASPDESTVAIGGSFTSLNGSSNPGYGLALVDSGVGALVAAGVNAQVRNAGVDSAIFSLASDGDSFYGTGYIFGEGGNLESTFRASWATGDLVWVADCHGDTYSVAVSGDTVYTASHAHYCGNMDAFPQTDPWTFNRALAFTKNPTGTNTPDPYGYPSWGGTPRPDLLTWFPTINSGTFTGQAQGAWSVAANSQYAVYGGEFTTVNGKSQQGLVRFAVTSIAPDLDGPRLTGDNFVPTLDSPASGTVRVSWPANYDRDNEQLTYNVIRNGASGSPVYVAQETSTFWNRPTMTFLDDGLTPGQTYTYRLRAIDPHGNSAWGSTLSVIAGTSGSVSAYAEGVIDDKPTSYWRLGDASGSASSLDSAGADNGIAGSGVTFANAGAIFGDSTTAAGFSGTSSGLAASSTQVWRDNSFSVEAWFKTTSTTGGKIVGFGNRNTGDSTAYDRHVYMTTAGKVVFGVYPGSTKTISSSKSFNDGEWHHVVASLGPDGMTLFVDAKRVAANPDVTYGQGYWGYWSIGGDSSWGNPSFAGTIDEVALYPAPLTQEQVVEHYTLSGRTTTTPAAPTDEYGAAVYGQDPVLFWRLGESSGSVAADSGQRETPGSYSGSYSQGSVGGVTGTTNTAVDFTTGVVSSDAAFDNPTTYSTEVWFQTTTTQGGKLTGFGNRQAGTSSSYDRHVYMQDDGRLVFGTWTGVINTITSTDSYNDGSWHQVVASQSSAGMKLYVDGELVGTNSQTGAENYSGYWRVGGDTTWGSSSPWFDGTLDEFAVYDTALSAPTVEAHYLLGVPVIANEPPTASFDATESGLSVSVDASASTDADGTISNYSWDFGDGETGTGATSSHDYASSDTYTITLTVTDDDGLSSVTTRLVTVAGPNAAPTASFDAVTTDLELAVDASTSGDPDGTIVSYAWDFGDGETGTGETTTHSYGPDGTFTVTLTVTDDGGLTDTTTRTVVTTVPSHLEPIPSFTATVTDLAVVVDGSASTDPDGMVAAWGWTWGDGSPESSNATATHFYAAPGTYTIELLVVDNWGHTATTTQEVVVTAPAGVTTLAEDTFGRTTASGWGSATTGGAWTSNATSSYFVNDGSGAFSHTAGSTRRAILNAVSTTDANITAQISTDKAATGGGAYAGIVGRQAGSDYYQARARFLAGGTVGLQILRGSSTVLSSTTVSGLTYAAGERLTLRVQVTGTSPTTIRAKVWAEGTLEPADWTVSTTDATAALQVAGAIGVESYLSGSATNAPALVRYDNLLAVSGAPEPTPNVAPTAGFAMAGSDRTVNTWAWSSSDSDGAITAYAWDFGDGSTGTGLETSHVYAAAGTYTVTLTVTDDDGATDTDAMQWVASDPTPPPAGTAIASDAFGRTTVDGWGAADVGGAWTSAASANIAVNNGSGAFTHTPASTHRALLTSVADTDVELAATVTADQAATGGNIVAGLVGRQIGTEFYQGRARLLPGGSVAVQVLRNSSTLLANATVAGLAYTAGQQLNVKVRVTGSSPTTISAKVWAVGQTEPAGWQVTATDSTASLQAAGVIGVESYLSAMATGAPVTVRFDDFTATHVE